MTTIEVTNQDMYQTIADDASITVLEKQVGRTTSTDISEALSEYKRLFQAGIASDAETLTLARAYPNDSVYSEAANRIEIEPVVVGGPASVSLIDREGHLITTDALEKAFKQYMANFRTRNTMVLHSDVQVGWALPAYISKSGDIFKSGVDDKGLFFVTEIRNDTKIAKKVLDQIHDGKLKSYSIAGSATKTQNKTKGLMPYMQVDEMELAEITVCERGVNQAASFDILKGHDAATHTCTDGSCLMDTPTPKDPLELIMKADGNIDFVNSFSVWMEKGPLTNIARRALSGAEKVERGVTSAMSTPKRLKDGAKAAGKSFLGNALTTKKGERQRAKYGQPSKRPAQGAAASFASGFKATPPSSNVAERAKRISNIKARNSSVSEHPYKKPGSTSAAGSSMSNVKRGEALSPDWAKGKTTRSVAFPSSSAQSKQSSGATLPNYRAKTNSFLQGISSAAKNKTSPTQQGKTSPATTSSTSASTATPPTSNKKSAEQVAVSDEARYARERDKRNKAATFGGRKTVISRQGRMGPKDYDIEKAGMGPALQSLVIDSSKPSGSKGVEAGRRGSWSGRRDSDDWSKTIQDFRDVKWSKAPSKRLEGQGPAAPHSKSGIKYAPYGSGNIQKGAFLAAIPAALSIGGKVASKVAGKTLAVGGKAAAKGTAKLAAKGAKAGTRKIGSSMSSRPAPRSQEADDYQTKSADKQSHHLERRTDAYKLFRSKGKAPPLKKPDQGFIDSFTRYNETKDDPSYKTKSVDLLLGFISKENYTPGSGKKSPMASPEEKPNIGKVEHEQHDQDQNNSENAFKLQEKETDVVFNKENDGENLASKQQKVFEQVTRDYNKDEDIEKQEANLVTEYSTNEIQTEKATDLIMPDVKSPSTPSMGWFDMLKEELKADVLTDIEMTKSYPGWKQDPESYSEHWDIMKNKITEGYK